MYEICLCCCEIRVQIHSKIVIHKYQTKYLIQRAMDINLMINNLIYTLYQFIFNKQQINKNIVHLH